MIKPDAVENGHIGAILEKITSAGFKIVAMKYTQLGRRDAETPSGFLWGTITIFCGIESSFLTAFISSKFMRAKIAI